MSLETALASLPPDQWAARQVIVFDWFDGPREGVAWLAKPDCEFSFELLDEQSTPDDLDERSFRLRELPKGTGAGILAALRGLGEPANTLWVPVWRFGNETERAKVEQEIDRLLAGRRRTGIVVRTRDMMDFAGCRLADSESVPGPP
jgi:hypothetical protein